MKTVMLSENRHVEPKAKHLFLKRILRFAQNDGTACRHDGLRVAHCHRTIISCFLCIVPCFDKMTR